MEMHHRHFVELWVFLIEVETLRLADIWPSCNSEIHHLFLTDLPYCLVNFFQISRNLFYTLYASIISNNLVLDRGIPKIELDQISDQMFIYADKFTRQDSSCVDIRGEWLKALIVSKDL